MKRSIRVRMNFIVDIDDEGTGIPRHPDVGGALARAAELVVPGAVHLHPGGTLSLGLTRESSRAARKAARRDDAIKRHALPALRALARSRCNRRNCGTVCLCDSCHARKALETLDPDWRAR